MSLYSSFYASLSGLTANAGALTVIGNNLANLNTVGFKGSTSTFQDLFNATIGGVGTSGNGNPIQVGLGSRLGAIQQNFVQGSFQSTSNVTDMAISGNGFFVVQDSQGGRAYTRAGNFTVNKFGQMVDPGGNSVLGWNRVGNAVTTTGTVSPIQINMGITSPPSSTNSFSATTNLNASAAMGSSYSMPVQIYDSLGASHSLIFTYTKSAPLVTDTNSVSLSSTSSATLTKTMAIVDSLGAQHNVTLTYTNRPVAGTDPAGTTRAWDLTVTNDGGATAAPSPQAVCFDAAGALVSTPSNISLTGWSNGGTTAAFAPPTTTSTTGASTSISDPPSAWNLNVATDGGATVTGAPTRVAFDSSGALIIPTTNTNPTMTATGWSNGAAPTALTWNLWNNGSSTLTGYSAPSTTSNTSQDGFGAGTIRSLLVDQTGLIIGNFTNGQTMALAKVSLATFANVNGLSKQGDNTWVETLASGSGNIGVANEGGRGAVLGANLELGNVDVAEEFTKLIISQRGYQANGRVVTTSDELMQETLNLKR